MNKFKFISYLYFTLNLSLFTACTKTSKTFEFLDKSDSKSIGTIQVLPRYENAPNWNDYVRTQQDSSVCDGTEVNYSECTNGAEHKIVRTQYPNCTSEELSLSMTDNLGFFDWSCKVEDGSAVFYGKMKGNISLVNLIDITNPANPIWKSNYVVLKNNGIKVNASAETGEESIWWKNPLEQISNTSTNEITLTSNQTNVGKIFVVSSNISSNSFVLGSDKLGFVIMPGFTFTFTPGAAPTKSCNSTVATSGCMVYATSNRMFLWVEGDTFDLNSDARGQYAIQFSGTTKFSKIHNVKIKNQLTTYACGSAAGIYLNGYANTITNSSVDKLSCSGIQVLGFNHILNNIQITGSNVANSYGLRTGSSNSLFENISSSNTGHGVFCNTCNGNTFKNLTLKKNITSGIYLNGLINQNTFQKVNVNGSAIGVYITGSSNNGGVANQNLFKEVQLVDNATGIQNDSDANVKFNKLVISNTTVRAVRCNSGYLVITEASMTSNSGNFYGMIGNHTSSAKCQHLILNGVTISGVYDGHGINFLGPQYNHVLSNILITATGAGSAAGTSNPTSNSITYNSNASGRPAFVTVSNAALTNASNKSVWLGPVANFKFTGNLMISNTAGTGCTVSASATSTGIVDNTCAASGSSNHNLSTGINLSTALNTPAYKGMVNGDAVNTSDNTLGQQVYSDTLDFFNFEYFFRTWGIYGGTIDPLAVSSRQACSGTSTCQIWDFGLASTNKVVRNTTGNTASAIDASGVISNSSVDAAGLNYQFPLTGGACPNEVNGGVASNVYYTEPGCSDGLATTQAACVTPNVWYPSQKVLKNAIENLGDNIGNDDGLCEENESCLYAPNFGGYQGDGELVSCNFTSVNESSLISNVQMQGYKINGR